MLHSQDSNTPTATQHPGAAGDDIQQLPENKLKTETQSAVVTLTDGADYAGVARCDWLLLNVQQAEMLQKSVSRAGIQLLALDERVRLCHRLGVAPAVSWSNRDILTAG